MVMEITPRPRLNWQRLGFRIAGAGLLAVTGAIHLDLYQTGYRSIPVIGWLFLVQAIAAFAFAGPRRCPAAGGPLWPAPGLPLRTSAAGLPGLSLGEIPEQIRSAATHRLPSRVR